MSLMIFTPTWVDADGTDAMYLRCGFSIEAQKLTPPANGVLRSWLHPCGMASVVTEGFEWVIGRENPYAIGDHRNVLHQYQKAREIFLASRHEALLTVEHDMVLPDVHAAQRMMCTPADVVYGVYLLRQGRKLNAWRYVDNEHLGEPLNKCALELRDARKAGIWHVCGVGFGCTLIRRHVMERLEFRGDGLQNAPDIPFAVDALREGFISRARFDVMVGHIENGVTLMPFG